MSNDIKPPRQATKAIALAVLSAFGVASCGGDQAGVTNGGFSSGGSSGAVIGVIGGAVLVGALVASDDDSGGAVTNPDGTITNPDGTVTNPDGTITNPDGTVTNPDGTITNPDGTVTNPDGTTTNPDGTVTNPDGTVTNPDGTVTNPDGTVTNPDGTVSNPDGTVSNPDGSVSNPDGSVTPPQDGSNQGIVTSEGTFQAALTATDTVPASNSSGSGNADFTFDVNTGDSSGLVTLTGVDATGVNIFVGPPGANGFVAIALEQEGNTGVWRLPPVLSAEQLAIIQQNINAGNLYVAATSAQFPNGELRRQLVPENVSQFRTNTVTGTRGGTAEGFLMLNDTTGDYAITWNTSGGPALDTGSSHVNDGVVSGSTENIWAPLTVRASNLEQFFAFGNANDPADPLFPDLVQRLADGMVWLDSHAASDGERVFFGQLQRVQ